MVLAIIPGLAPAEHFSLCGSRPEPVQASVEILDLWNVAAALPGRRHARRSNASWPIEKHVERILDKLGVGNRSTAAVTLARTIAG